MVRVPLVLGVLLGALVLAGCTDRLSLSSATLEEPSFDLEPLTGDKDTLFQVDAGALSKYNVTWDWGDGVLTYGGASEHKYGFTNGRMTVTLIATDEGGKQGIATREIVLGTGLNKDPSVSVRVTPRAWVEVGKNVNLTASGSDGDRDPLTYLWTTARLQDGAPGESVVLASTARTASTSFDAPGRYLVVVRAQDPKGGQDEAQLFVDVSKKIPSSTFEALFNGTIKAGTAGASASEKAWIASPPAPDTDVDAIRHPYTLLYPGTTVIFLTWNDTSTVGAFDLDLELRNEANETVFKSENHVVNPASPGAPTPLPPFEFNVTTQDPGTYWVIIRAHTGANVVYNLLVHASLRITPELVAAVEGA